jgi:hypothetical protein
MPPPARRKEPGFFSQAVQALDFSEVRASKLLQAAPQPLHHQRRRPPSQVRSKSDADLLYEAKYGELKDGKMSREQYAALRRKIGGTAWVALPVPGLPGRLLQGVAGRAPCVVQAPPARSGTASPARPGPR